MTIIQKHKYDVWASNLLFLTFGLSVLVGYIRQKGYFASDLHTKDYIILCLINPIVLVIYYYIRKGLREVKILFLVLYGGTLVQLITNGRSILLPEDPLKTFDLLSQHLLQIGASLMIILSLWPFKQTSTTHKA